MNSDPFAAAFERVVRSTVRDLLDEHRAAVRRDIQMTLADLRTNSSADVEGAFDSKAAATYLGISTRTLARMKKDGRIPHVRIGRQIRYRRADLDKYLNENLEP